MAIDRHAIYRMTTGDLVATMLTNHPGLFHAGSQEKYALAKIVLDARMAKIDQEYIDEYNRDLEDKRNTNQVANV